MKLKTLLLLVVLAGGMFAYLYWGVQKAAEKKEAQDEKESKLAEGDLANLQSVSITIEGKKLEMKKEKNGWQILQPYQDIASQSKIDNLSAALGRLKKSKQLYSKDEVESKKVDLAQFQLNPPKARIEYKTSDLTQPVVILLGKANPSASGTYVEIGEKGPVDIATMDLDYLTTQTPEDFREMRLTTVDGSKFAEASITYKNKTIKFKRNAADKWEMTEPYSSIPIDPEMVKGQMDKIGYLRANHFEKTPSVKLGKPDIKIVVGFKEGIKDLRTKDSDARPNGTEIWLYKVSKPQSGVKPPKKSPLKKSEKPTIEYEYFAKGDKTDYAAVSEFHFDNFTKTADDFIRKTFDTFEVSQVQKATITKPGLSDIVISKKSDGTYSVAQGNTTKAGNKENVEKALRQIRSLHATAFITREKAPAHVAWTLTLDLPDQKSERFAFDFKKDAAYLWFSSGEQQLKYVFPKDPLALKDFEFDALTQAPKDTTSQEIKEITKTLEKTPSAQNSNPSVPASPDKKETQKKAK